MSKSVTLLKYIQVKVSTSPKSIHFQCSVLALSNGEQFYQVKKTTFCPGNKSQYKL